jgi:sulfite exporter TauE/SafE
VISAYALLGVAAAAGVAGSVHCVAMCGGIAGLGAAASRQLPARPVAAALLFHGGRVLVYALLGAGFALGAATALQLVPALESAGRLVMAVMLAALAVRILVNRDVLGLERLGAKLFRRLTPLWTRLLRAPGPLRQLALGAVWGLMPCGLVYSMLAVAVASGRPLLAAASMAVFGLGTVPALAAITVGADRLRAAIVWLPGARLASGLLVLACALWTGTGAVLHLRHAHDGHGEHHAGASVALAPTVP